MTKTKKSKNKKVVLASALLLAGVIAVGGTFAWFTSKDEVTNRLTASGSYGVSITESFTPPSTWTPGQTVEKEVAAVNTGNTAAYVKLDLTDALSVKTENAELVTMNVLSAVNATDYVVLTLDEVISAEAGGQLVYASELKKVETIVKDNTTGATTTTTKYMLGTTDVTSVTAGEFYTTISSTGLYVFERTDLDGNVVYSGYYVVNDGNGNTFYKVDLTGFTMTEDSSSTSSSTSGNITTQIITCAIKRGNFYLVKKVKTTTTDNSNLIIFSTKIFNSNETYSSGLVPYGDGYYTSSTEPVYYIQAVYDPDYQTTDFDASGWSSSQTTTYNRSYGSNYYTDPDPDNNIIINIALYDTWERETGNEPTVWTSDDWTAVYSVTTDDETPDTWTFYYNHILSAGTTSYMLVTDMQLDTSVSNQAYNEFTYDLIVGLNSVQVVTTSVDENGIGLVQIPSDSIVWVEGVSTSANYRVNVDESSLVSGASAANDKLIFVNESGQVCTSAGRVTDNNNNLTWSFTAQ